MRKHKIAVIHGRFQPFHLGHFRYAELCFEMAEELIIGITNPDNRSLTEMEGDRHRHLPESNPFTYYERARIIQKTMQDKGIPPERYLIVPFTIEDLKVAVEYVPNNAVFYLRDRGSWTETKLRMLKQSGFDSKVLENNDLLEVSGTAIRNLILDGGNWQQFVSPTVVKEIEKTNFYKNVSRK